MNTVILIYGQVVIRMDLLTARALIRALTTANLFQLTVTEHFLVMLLIDALTSTIPEDGRR